MWNHVDRGTGTPLVLLHGIGMSNKAWKPVIPMLAEHRRVIAFDTAGFGQSTPLHDDIPPTTINLVHELHKNLQQLEIKEPVDFAGNSLGGWMALEAAKLGIARSVVAISPAGLWEKPPAYTKHLFFGMRKGMRTAPQLVKNMLKLSVFRECLLAVPLTTGCSKMPAKEAIETSMDFVNACGFEETLRQAHRFRNGHQISVPTTIAFGSHDLLLTKKARLKNELPKHTKWIEPKGWGHVPMWKDPEGVARLILENTNL